MPKLLTDHITLTVANYQREVTVLHIHLLPHIFFKFNIEYMGGTEDEN